jgi:flagellar protein FlaJ
MDIELTQRKKVTIISSIVSIWLIIIGIISSDSGVLGNLFVLAVFAFIIPQFLYRYSRYMWIKNLEQEFPNFIRGVADSIRSGMSFKEAIKIASRSRYGKLTEEVQAMNNRLQWGVDFIRAMDIFAERVKESKIITESIAIIKESFKSGGNVADTLDSIARNIVMFKEVEAERESLVRQHVMIMYGIFFMFVGIALTTIFVMVPMIRSQPETITQEFGFQFVNPCQAYAGFPCNYFSFVGAFLEIPEGISMYYIALFFNVVIILGIFVGLIVGQLGENSIIAGSKHSIIMATIAVAIFVFLSKVGLLPV